jgi:hypothetical protein
MAYSTKQIQPQVELRTFQHGCVSVGVDVEIQFVKVERRW